MSAAAQSFASCCAQFYELPIVDYLLGQSFHPGGPKLTHSLAIATLISPDSHVLDVACGNGNSARVIAADFGATVTGCDYSAINLERAKQASHAANLRAKTRYVRSAAEDLPFASSCFDVAVCECSLCLFANMDTALSQLHRVLKPGGRIGISDFYLNSPIPQSLEGLLGQVLCVSGAPSAEGYRQAIERAGFEHVRLRLVNWTLSEMIERVRRRLHSLRNAGDALLDVKILDWGDAGQILDDLDAFINSGGAGYLIATGRKR